MSQPLTVSGYEIHSLYHEGSARVTITQAGSPVFEAQVGAIHDFLPFRFATDGGEVRGMVSRSGRNAVLVAEGRPPVVAGPNPDFHRIAAKVFVPGTHLGWSIYSLAQNLLAGGFVGLALVWGLFSSLDPLFLAGVSLAGFVVSYAIDLARDRRVLSALRDTLE